MKHTVPTPTPDIAARQADPRAFAEAAARLNPHETPPQVAVTVEEIARRLNGGKRPQRLGPGLGEPL